MKLNNLTRWFVRTTFLMLILASGLPVLSMLWSVSILRGMVSLLLGAQFMFLTGLSLKFLPSSLGANPRVYSLSLAVWTYWLILGGSVAWGVGEILTTPSFSYELQWLITIGSLTVVAGGVCALVNVWKSTRRRV